MTSGADSLLFGALAESWTDQATQERPLPHGDEGALTRSIGSLSRDRVWVN